MFEIKIKITTVSCCLIGNQTESFSVGGVDQSTTTDEKGNPIIHGSAFKGALRNLIREKYQDKMKNTTGYMKSVIKETLKKYENEDINKTEKINKIISNLKYKNENFKSEYIFGIERVNGMPRLFCSDFRVSKCKDRKEDYFLIDTKNSLEEKDGNIFSNPRTYKVIKPGVEFEGIIRFYNPFSIEKIDSSKEELIKKELIEVLEEFNLGLYRIGNSKSRGYGQIKVEIIN